MIELLSIMLHLLLVFSPGTYTVTEISQIESTNQVQIDNVRQDQVLLDWVIDVYSPDAEIIVVIDPNEQ